LGLGLAVEEGIESNRHGLGLVLDGKRITRLNRVVGDLAVRSVGPLNKWSLVQIPELTS
jgi:hypothetical protein